MTTRPARPIRFLRPSAASFRCGLAVVAAAALLAGSARAQVADLFGAAGAQGARDTGVKVAARLVAPKLAAGEPAVLVLDVRVPQGFYIYSASPKAQIHTTLNVADGSGLEPLEAEFRPEQPPKVIFEPLLMMELEKHYDRVVWSRRFKLPAGRDLAGLQVSGTIEGQYCSEGPTGRCVQIRPPLAWTAVLAEGEPHAAGAAHATGASGAAASSQAPVATSAPYLFDLVPQVKDNPGPAELRFELAPATAKPGDEVTFSLRMKLQDGWHTYALTQDPKNSGQPLSFAIEKTPGLEPVDEAFASDAPHETKVVDLVVEKIEQHVHHGTITWTRKYRVAADAESSGYGIAGLLTYQTCDARRCLPAFRIPFALGRVPEAVPAAVAENPPVRPPVAPDVPPRGAAAKEPAAKPLDAAAPHDDPRQQGLVGFLLAAVLAGFAALLTPCVFPMIPITVSFFLKQSEQQHHRPVRMATIYCLGIVGTFTVLGLLLAALFGATKLNELANNAWLNLGIAAVLVFFGMNLLGLFELRVPSWLLTWSAGKEGQGGVIGVLFMAFTFTLVSFTCTFAFAGLLLVWAANGEYFWPILGMLAFSAAFSLPFFFLALFPSLLRSLPRSGGWMNVAKVVMGLIELGAAFKFLSVFDLALNPVPMLFDYATVMSAWMVISIAMGLYLLGLFRTPHDTPVDSISPVRLVGALSSFGLAAYLAVGLFAPQKPTGKLWEQIAAFAPPTFHGGENELGPYLEHDGLQYALDFDKARELAKKRNVPLFVDFTGVNCVNCRQMEQTVLPQKANRDLLEKLVRVQVYTDAIPTLTDPTQVEMLLKKNQELQTQWFGDATLPSYAIVAPDGTTLLSKHVGGETEQGEFTAFLRAGLSKLPNAEAFLPKKKSSDESTELGLSLEHDGLRYGLDFDRAVALAKKRNVPLFVDFAGVNSVHSRMLEATVYARKENRDLLERLVRVQVYIDTIPLVSDPVLQKRMYDRNIGLLTDLIAESAIAQAVLAPDGTTVLSKHVGTESLKGEFTEFLRSGLAKFDAQKLTQTPAAAPGKSLAGR